MHTYTSILFVAYIHTYIHTYINAYIHTYIYTYIHTSAGAHLWAQVSEGDGVHEDVRNGSMQEERSEEAIKFTIRDLVVDLHQP